VGGVISCSLTLEVCGWELHRDVAIIKDGATLPKVTKAVVVSEQVLQ